MFTENKCKQNLLSEIDKLKTIEELVPLIKVVFSGKLNILKDCLKNEIDNQITNSNELTYQPVFCKCIENVDKKGNLIHMLKE